MHDTLALVDAATTRLAICFLIAISTIGVLADGKRMPDRFDHPIEAIGSFEVAGVEAGTTEVVLVVANGFSRLAIVRFGERNVLGRSYGETWYTDDGDDFVTFVDADLADRAVHAQRTNVGAVKVIDVHAGHTFRNATILDAWIAQTGRSAIGAMGVAEGRAR